MDAPRSVPVRPAATIVVAREADRGLEVLMVRRTRAMEFAGGAHVFPGGAVDPADSDAALVAACVGLDDAEASQRLGIPSGGLAYWICAMRECFEEAGLLYAYTGEGLARFESPARETDSFGAIVTSRGLRLAADRLAYLSHWITQAGRPRRYDTRFFIAAAPEHQRPMHDGSEAVGHDWIAPRAALERHARGEIQLLFPTIKTLETLARFERVADAMEYARSPRPMPPMAPRSAVGRQGPKLLVPGDYAYAEVGKLDPEGQGTASYEIVPGTVVQVAPRIRRLTAPNPGAMTGPGTNTYLLGDAASGIAVIDPGPLIETHIEAILASAGGRIEWFLCTHSHVDHSPAAAPLKARTGARVLGMRARYSERQDPTFVPDRELAHGDRLEIAGFRLRVLHTPGHASNQLCFLEEGERLLFTGDHLMQGSTVVINPPDGDMATYLASLRLLLAEDLDHIAPGHGFLMGRPHEMVERVLIHRQERENKVIAQLAEHGPVTLEALLPHVYEDVPLRMHPVASRSLLAHLLKLRDEGRAAEVAGTWRAERPT
ncbi:MAG TPA: MBL fold metallo-hydrolase [Burkholderiales bacterium]|nr:MBL fold metallo-hydrolase [Burkholderiales bacterium]